MSKIEDVTRKYRKIYGKKLDKCVSEMFHEMIEARDGDSLMLLSEHLIQGSKIVREQIESMPAVILDDEGKAKMN